VLPTGAALGFVLASGAQYRAPASGCTANITLQAGAGGNAVLGLGGNGAGFTASVWLPPLAPGSCSAPP
jgi:hypothetical protein